MKKEYRHEFRALHRKKSGGFAGQRPVSMDAPMYDGQIAARDMARDSNCDIEHRVYNDYLYKWDYLATYHPGGTATDWAGKRRRFIENPACPWKGIR